MLAAKIFIPLLQINEKLDRYIDRVQELTSNYFDSCSDKEIHKDGFQLCLSTLEIIPTDQTVILYSQINQT